MRKLTKLIGAFCAFIIALIVLMMLSAKLVSSGIHGHHINTFLHDHTIVLTLWRYLLMLLFIVLYPRLIRRLYSNKRLSEEKLRKLSKRYIAILICVCYEVIIVHNLISHLVTLVVGGA